MDEYGGTMHLKESYICDKCNTLFYVKAKVSFETQIRNDGKPYKMRLSKNKLTLEEE